MSEASAVETLARLRAVAAEARAISSQAGPRDALLKDAQTARTGVLELFHGRIKDLVREKSELQEALDSTQRELAAKEPELQSLQRKADETAAEAIATHNQLDAVRTEKQELQAKISTLDQESKAAEAAWTREKQEFERKAESSADKLREAEKRLGLVKSDKEKAESKVQALQQDLVRLNQAIEAKTRAFDEQLRQTQAQRDLALRDKVGAEEKLAALQEQWERISQTL